MRRAGRRSRPARCAAGSAAAALPFRREQPFGLELLLELLEGRLQRSDALQFHLGHPQLVLPARLIHRHVALQVTFRPSCNSERSTCALAAKQHAAQLGAGVLEREIDMPGALEAQIRHLARHPDLAYLLLEQTLDLPCQVG